MQIARIIVLNNEKLEKSTLENNYNKTKLKAIKSQMNPHFFYNALNTIQSFILTNEKKMAIEYLSKFSNLTRTILELSEKDFVTVAEEIETLKLYLDLEKARFNDDEMYYEIAMSKPETIENLKIPSMLLQPYVENALKHGLLHKKGLKTLKILFEKANKTLIISLDDNGIGRQNSLEINKNRAEKRSSFATNAIENRIEILNQFSDNKIEIEFIDKKNQQDQATGTIVIFKIFYKNTEL